MERQHACRIGEVLNIHATADDLGISDDTAKRRILVLEKSDVITLLRPYSNNALHRTIKLLFLPGFQNGLKKIDQPVLEISIKRFLNINNM